MEWTQESQTGIAKALEAFREGGVEGVTQDYIKRKAINSAKASGFIKGAIRQTERDFKEQFFRGINFRTFTFNWTFNPKNAKEHRDVQEIIKTFRFYAAPSISPGNAFWLFPAFFQIQFFTGKNEITSIPKILPCALTEVSVDYAPNNTMYMHSDGNFNDCTMNLTFTEVETIDRSMIDGSTTGSGY